MAAKERREIERFDARSDDGEYETTIVIYQDFIDAGTRGSPNAVIPGMKEVTCPNAMKISRKSAPHNDLQRLRNVQPPVMMLLAQQHQAQEATDGQYYTSVAADQGGFGHTAFREVPR